MCEATDCRYGFHQGNISHCKMTGCDTGLFAGSEARYSWADGGATGFSSARTSHCIATGCTTKGIAMNTVDHAWHCTVDACAIGIEANTYGVIENCLITNSTTQGINLLGAYPTFNHCASDDAGSTPDEISPAWAAGHMNIVDVTTDPYTDRAGDDYSINDTWATALTVAGGLMGQSDAPLIGAVQPAAGGGASSMLRRSSQRGGY